MIFWAKHVFYMYEEKYLFDENTFYVDRLRKYFWWKRGIFHIYPFLPWDLLDKCCLRTCCKFENNFKGSTISQTIWIRKKDSLNE